MADEHRHGRHSARPQGPTHVGLVEFTVEEPQLASLLGGEIAWHSTSPEFRAALTQSPVEAIVFHVNFDDRNGLVNSLEEVKQTRPELRTLLAATTDKAFLLAEIIAIVPSGAVRRWTPLTERENQVLQAIKAGRTNREIANLLGISLSTVNRHVENILHKLAVRNRAQAAAESPKSDYQLRSRGDASSVLRDDARMDAERRFAPRS